MKLFFILFITKVLVRMDISHYIVLKLNSSFLSKHYLWTFKPWARFLARIKTSSTLMYGDENEEDDDDRHHHEDHDNHNDDDHRFQYHHYHQHNENFI